MSGSRGYLSLPVIQNHAAFSITGWFIYWGLGMPDLRFRDMRHSYAAAALINRNEIKTVQGNLGHHTAAFTLDTYAHGTEQMKRESAARMDAFIEPVKGG